MADTHRQLAQSAPAALTNVTIYTVPASTKARVYGVVVANTRTASAKFRLYLVPSAGSATDSNVIYKDIVVPGGDAFVANIVAVMEAAGFIVAYSDTGDLTFTISGMERTTADHPFSLDAQLAQSDPAANTNTTVYTVPASTKALVFGIIVANTGNIPDPFRIFIVPSAGVAGVGNAIYYDVIVPGQDTFVANIQVLMEAGGFIVVYSTSGAHTFTFSGIVKP